MTPFHKVQKSALKYSKCKIHTRKSFEIRIEVAKLNLNLKTVKCLLSNAVRMLSGTIRTR